MNPAQRFKVGAFGGLAVILGNLVVADIFVLTTASGATAVALSGFIFRSTIMCTLSGLHAWHLDDANTRNRLFRSGTAAAIAIVAVLNGNAVGRYAAQEAGRRAGSQDTVAAVHLIATVHASQQIEQFQGNNESATQQFLRGLLSLPAKKAPEYFVGIEDVKGHDQALQRQGELTQTFPALDLHVFEACGEQDGCNRYVVTVGGQTSLEEAMHRRDLAVAGGIQNAEIRRVAFPSRSP